MAFSGANHSFQYTNSTYCLILKNSFVHNFDLRFGLRAMILVDLLQVSLFKKGKKEKKKGKERETCNTCPPMRGHICLLLSDGQNTVRRQFL